ncbi:MAG TPA: flagellar hook capping FlgD N-terminal domain-containing protein [Candidatus Baltobacteraceae bacterium]|jgi:flagellar basal-body rod modification protein FlgD|nr:flagellar hook capping FlgD N-terminal domain-containing protein [Candidatus Baltobacteraceae bacterium]
MSTSGVIPTSQLTTQPNPADQLPGTQSSSSGSDLSPNAFLQLLTTEMMNQDPTQPQDPTQSVTQLAQFSALQYQQQLTSAFQGFQSNFAVLQASSLVGKQVTVGVTDSSGNAQNETGTIDTIEVQNGQPYFTMVQSNGQPYDDNNGNPLLFSLQQILGIGAGTTGGSTGNTGGTNPGTGGSGGNGS